MTMLRFSELRAAGIPWSRTHLARLEAEGRFPKRVHVGPGTVAWLKEEVDDFKRRAIAARG
jgi:prophage regulatory protein